MSTQVLKIGTRKSPLALWQAEHVKARLEQQHAKSGAPVAVELVGIETKGDKILDVALAKVGGKGLFVKELEQALLDGRVDLCVHSTKDVPAELPEGTAIVAFPPRADPRDCFAAPVGAPGGRGVGGVAALPRGARVGTSSLRRQAQLLQLRPDLVIVPVRGNVATRLKKVEELSLSCVVLAAAGLDRLENAATITHRFSVEEMLPAAGQGVLAIQARVGDDVVLPKLAFLDDETVRITTSAERAFLKGLGGGCQVPIAAHAVVVAPGRLFLRGLVARPDGRVVVSASIEGSVDDAVALGAGLADDVKARGGARILEEVEHVAGVDRT